MKLDKTTYDNISFSLNRYEKQKSGDHQRVLINSPNDAIQHMLNIIKETVSPYMVLYVLATPRVSESGRYELSSPLNYDELMMMLVEYKEFFETDSRHELWLVSLNGGELLAYDTHDIIYAYNFDNSLEEYLIENFFVNEVIEIPFPHTHNYYPQFDVYEKNLLYDYNWIRSDLKEEDIK